MFTWNRVFTVLFALCCLISVTKAVNPPADAEPWRLYVIIAVLFGGDFIHGLIGWNKKEAE